MPHRRIQAHYEQLSEFERGHIIGLKEGGWANWRIAHHMGRSDAAIRRCWQELVNNGRFQCHDGSGRPRTTEDQEDIDCWNHAEWGRIVFSDEFRFHLCPDDHRRRVWRRLGQRADPAFTMASHTRPQQRLIIWSTISFEAGPLWSSLEAHLQHIGTYMAFRELFCYRSFCRTLGLFFQQDNAKPHTTRVAMICLTAY
ncbi:uncharacterized protein TNCV_789301 [Trichonephila clavipes]|nr:uncharacterized protein TNCV_789301 [Trichonephila clavipes]